MDSFKTKSLDKIEEKIQGAEENSFRQHVLKSAKGFKTSWIELGRAMYAVWKDKMFKEWGYSTIDAYSTKEIGIRKQTVMKLLRSYYFLEKEEPGYLRSEYIDSSDASKLPTYESVDVLRTARNKKDLDSQDYMVLKKEIFEKGKDARDVKKDLVSMMRQRQELDPEEAHEKKRATLIKRLLSTLKMLKKEIEISKLASASVVKETESLIRKIESEMNLG